MGTNFYFYKKAKYDPSICFEDYGTDSDNEVTPLSNGFVWQNTYYPSVEELNKVYMVSYHIGKSSSGWHFLLCVYPKIGIKSLADWKKQFKSKNSYILNEYGEEVPVKALIASITKRSALVDGETVEECEQRILSAENKLLGLMSSNRRYLNYEELLKRNGAVRGINGLLAHRDCERTDGTYDLTTRPDFS